MHMKVVVVGRRRGPAPRIAALLHAVVAAVTLLDSAPRVAFASCVAAAWPGPFHPKSNGRSRKPFWRWARPLFTGAGRVRRPARRPGHESRACAPTARCRGRLHSDRTELATLADYLATLDRNVCPAHLPRLCCPASRARPGRPFLGLSCRATLCRHKPAVLTAWLADLLGEGVLQVQALRLAVGPRLVELADGQLTATRRGVGRGVEWRPAIRRCGT